MAGLNEFSRAVIALACAGRRSLARSKRLDIFTLVRLILGAAFLGVAYLKLSGLVFTPRAPISLFDTPQVMVLALEIEALLGLWLLWGRYRPAAWACTLVYVVLLANVSLLMVVNGQGSCICFGRPTHPIVAFVADLAAIAMLAVCRPPAERGRRVPIRRVIMAVSGAGAIVVICGAIFFLVAEKPLMAWARLRGEAVTLTPALVDVGVGRIGQERTFTVGLANNTSGSIRITGGPGSRCAHLCKILTQLPMTLGRWESEAIELQLNFGTEPGRFRQSFVLYTDDPQQPFLVGAFTGRVTE